MILILILGKIIYRYIDIKNSKKIENMDMSLFQTDDGGNFKNKSYDPLTKSRLEALEFKLLREKFVKLMSWLKKRDYDVVYDPLSPPEKRIEALQRIDIDDPGTRFNIRTRGEPDNYILLGILYSNNNTTTNVKYQLFGRQIYPGAYEWEYYIRGKDNGGLDYKIPIKHKNNNEIYNGDDIFVDIDNTTYKAKIYPYDQPRYNPYI